MLVSSEWWSNLQVIINISLPVPVSAHPQETDGESLHEVITTLEHGTNSNLVRFKISYTSPGKSTQQKIFKAPP